jgi:TetR/AcrR family transcriptional regulator
MTVEEQRDLQRSNGSRLSAAGARRGVRTAGARRNGRGATDTYDVILAVAEDEFAHSGYKGTSLEVIARRARIRKASLFHHFNSKRRLFDAVLRRLFDQMSFIWRENTRSDDPKADVLAIVSRLHDFIVRHPNYARLLMHRVLEDPKSVRNTCDVFIKPLLLYMSELLTAGAAAGFFRKLEDPVGTALAALGIPVIAYAFAPVVEACTGQDMFSPRSIAYTREEVLRRASALVTPQA